MRIHILTDDKQINADGTMTVYLRITADGGKRFKVKSGITCNNKPVGMVFPDRERNARIKTARLSQLYADVEAIGLKNPGASPDELKKYIRQLTGATKRNDGERLFTDWLDEFVGTKGKQSTITTYQQTRKKVVAYDPDATLRSMNSEWLTRFDRWMATDNNGRKGMSVNGKAIVLRNIRSVFNYAATIDESVPYPFRKFTIRHEQTRKRNLTVQQLRQLRDFPCEVWHGEYRDLFMLQVYLAGIDAVDVLHLKKSDYADGYITYSRRKTDKETAAVKRIVRVRVEPEAERIINMYAGAHEWLLSPLDKYKDYHDYLHHWNDGLKAIGKVYRVGMKTTGESLFPGLTTKWSRHTWASIAAEIDISVDVIGRALGHSDGRVTDIYINFLQKKIDEANRKVIDYINE